MHNPICLHTAVMLVIQRHHHEPLHISFRAEQIKSLKLLFLLVSQLSAFFIWQLSASISTDCHDSGSDWWRWRRICSLAVITGVGVVASRWFVVWKTFFIACPCAQIAIIETQFLHQGYNTLSLSVCHISDVFSAHCSHGVFGGTTIHTRSHSFQ